MSPAPPWAAVAPLPQAQQPSFAKGQGQSPGPGAAPPPVPPRRRMLFQRREKTPEPESLRTRHSSPSPPLPNVSINRSAEPLPYPPPQTPPATQQVQHQTSRSKFGDAVRALGHGLPSAMRSAGPSSPISPVTDGERHPSRQSSRPNSRRNSMKAVASSSRVRLDIPDTPPPLPKTRKHHIGSLHLGSRSTPDLGAAKRAQQQRNKAAAETGAETTGKKRGRVSLGMLFQSRNRAEANPVPTKRDSSPLPQPTLPATSSAVSNSPPETPVNPAFRCPSCEALNEPASATTPRAMSRRPSHGRGSVGPGGRLSRPTSHSALRVDPVSSRGPPNALYNSVYRYGHSASLTSMPMSQNHPPLGMSLSQSSLTHSRTSLGYGANSSRTSLGGFNASNPNLHHNIYGASRTSLSLSQTSLILPDNGRNQLLSKDHYHLRFATTYIINLITPALRTANFQKSERNMEIKRITEERMTMLQRMERTWGSSWSEAAADLLNDATPSSVPLEVQEAKLRACNITATAKARERKVFVSALCDGILFCFLFNRLFPSQPARIQRVKVPKDETRIKANIDRFLSSCREVGVPESEMFAIGDLDEHSPGGLANVARTILVLAQMSGPTNVPRVRVGLQLSVSESSLSTAMAKSPSHSGTASTSPSQRSSATSSGAPRTVGDRPLRSSSSDLMTRLQNESAAANGSVNGSTSNTSSAPSTAPSAENVTSKVGGSARRLSMSITPPLSPVRVASNHASAQPLAQAQINQTNVQPIPTISAPMPAPVASTARPQQMRANITRAQVSFASDSSSPRASGHESHWTSSVSSVHSSSYLTPLQERSPPHHGVSDRMPHERTPPERSQLQERERTPSLVSASSHVPSSYSRSSMSATGFNGPIPTIVGEDFHSLDETEIAEVDVSEPPESSPSCQSPEARSLSEHTLQEARRKIIGTLMSSTEDLALSNHIQDDARGLALSQSLAALEGAGRPPIIQRRSESPRIRPISRGARAQSIELGQRLDEEGTPMPQRPQSELPPRTRIRRPSVNGKVLVPKRSQSPASPALSMVASPDSIVGGVDMPFGTSRIMTKEERRRSADSPHQPPARIMNLRNQSMVNLPSRRTSTLSRNPASNPDRDSMVHGSFQILEFADAEGQGGVRYQLGNCIGRGQFGSVYRSLNLSSGQMVAIKRIRLSGVKEKEVRDVMREVEVLQRLSHPGIVKYEGMSRDDQFLNIVLEFVENGSLGQTLKAFGKFNERLVASYVAKILEGLQYLHSQGVVHCDLKAANILSTKNGNIKLSDFGVSLNMRAVENFAERASIGRTVLKNEIAGTPNWMAPEVIKLAGASPASDIWSLGCTIIELLTGRPPYSDVPNSMTVLFRIVEDPMPPLPPASQCSEELIDFLKLCFVKEPVLRPTAAMLFEHEWVRAGRGDLLARPQDSLPFLRRLSQEPAHHRLEAQKVFSGNARSASASLASASMIDLGGGSSGMGMGMSHTGEAQMSMVSLHSVHPEPSPGGGPGSLAGGKAHALVKTSFAKPVTCHVCLAALKKQALLCQNCGLLTHSKCATRAHPKCDVREQLALLAHHQWSVPSSGTNSPYPTSQRHASSPAPSHPYPSSSPAATQSKDSLSFPARLFTRNKSKNSLAVPSASTTSLSLGDRDRERRAVSHPGSAYSSTPNGGTPGHVSPAPNGHANHGGRGSGSADALGSLRSRMSDNSDETGTGPRHPSLLRIDEDAPPPRPTIRIDEPTAVEQVKSLPPPVENTARRRQSMRRPRSSDGGDKKECLVQ